MNYLFYCNFYNGEFEIRLNEETFNFIENENFIREARFLKPGFQDISIVGKAILASQKPYFYC